MRSGCDDRLHEEVVKDEGGDEGVLAGRYMYLGRAKDGRECSLSHTL